MRKQIKKAAAVLVSAAFVLAMMPAHIGFAADDGATTFTFSETGITVEAGNYLDYKIDGTDLTITGDGDYVVKGECSDGSITVKKNLEDVTLTLSDLTLSSQNTAPLVVGKYAYAEIIIDGEVTLSDSINNSEDYLEEKLGMTEEAIDASGAEDAVIKLKDASRVAISGSGTLNVNAYAKNGIKSGSALDDNGESVAPGNADYHDAYLFINDITLNIDATGVYDPNDGDTHGDGINGECNVWLNSGIYNIAAGDDAVHSDYFLNIGTTGGDEYPAVIITKCTEGLEGALVNILGGEIEIYADEDAINAANSDLSDYQFRIMVTGGVIYAVANGDGDAFDSNGSIIISDGIIVASGGPMGNAFDTGTDGNNNISSTFAITGGTVLGFGSSQMAVTPVSGSQGYAIWTGTGSGFGPGGNGGGFTPPDGGNGGGFTPPDGGNGGGFTPPDGGNGGRPTPPDGGNGGSFTPPDGGNGERPTSPGGGNGGFPGGNSGSSTGTVTNLTLRVNETTYASGDQISISAGNMVDVMDGDKSLLGVVSANDASYVIYSSPGLEVTTDPENTEDPETPVDPENPDDPERSSSDRIERLYNPNSGEHFYTKDRLEAGYLKSLGWNDEGKCFGFVSEGVPIYRLYNPNVGDHFFTADKAEAENCINLGWIDEGIAWYDNPVSVEAYRLYNPNSGRHFFTENEAEAKYLVTLGWNDEGMAW